MHKSEKRFISICILAGIFVIILSIYQIVIQSIITFFSNVSDFFTMHHENPIDFGISLILVIVAVVILPLIIIYVLLSTRDDIDI